MTKTLSPKLWSSTVSDLVSFPSPVAAVTGKSRENDDWAPFLLDEEGRGLDPRKIDPGILSRAGHPPREMRTLRGVMCAGSGPNSVQYDEDLYPGNVRRYSDVTRHCSGCVDEHPRDDGRLTKAVLGCGVINCPFWAFRTGKNPHRPKPTEAQLEHLRRQREAQVS